jgi:hypothetical protein
MLSSILLGAGFGLAVASSATGDKLDKGSPALRPLNPILMNVASGLAGIAALIAMIGGFFLMGWIWLAVMLGGLVGAALLLLPFPRTPLLSIVTGLLGTALLLWGWLAL